jgi:hypothetical protein
VTVFPAAIARFSSALLLQFGSQYIVSSLDCC